MEGKFDRIMNGMGELLSILASLLLALFAVVLVLVGIVLLVMFCFDFVIDELSDASLQQSSLIVIQEVQKCVSLIHIM